MAGVVAPSHRERQLARRAVPLRLAAASRLVRALAGNTRRLSPHRAISLSSRTRAAIDRCTAPCAAGARATAGARGLVGRAGLAARRIAVGYRAASDAVVDRSYLRSVFLFPDSLSQRGALCPDSSNYL